MEVVFANYVISSFKCINLIPYRQTNLGQNLFFVWYLVLSDNGGGNNKENNKRG